jgi:hypothetical protein
MATDFCNKKFRSETRRLAKLGFVVETAICHQLRDAAAKST